MREVRFAIEGLGVRVIAMRSGLLKLIVVVAEGAGQRMCWRKNRRSAGTG